MVNPTRPRHLLESALYGGESLAHSRRAASRLLGGTVLVIEGYRENRADSI
jgi:hypothetical protein